MRSFILLFSISIMLLLVTNPTAQAQTRQTDSLALVMFYDSCCNTGCTLNWDFNQPMNNWTGVTLDNGRVIHLFLYNEGLSGTIPDFYLTELERLILFNGQLTGNIPDFSNLPKLNSLSLGHNLLTGNIPDFSNLALLENLHLDKNQLTGNIPDFSNLDSLKYLELNRNQLTGTIPNFSNLSELEILYLNTNQLTGNIPDFSNLPQLTQLILYTNQLTGNIPDFSNIPQLTQLNLSSNQLVGNIPNFNNLPSLTYVHLYRNQLTGTIPNLSNSPNLNALSLYSNKFTFEDILPNYSLFVNLPGSFTCNLQDSVGTAITVNPALGTDYTIDLIVDDTVTNNTYYWYKDGVLIDTTFGINEYTITNFQPTDAGVYTAQIKNSIISYALSPFTRLTLYSHPVTLSITNNTNQPQVEPLQVFPNPTQDMLYIQAQELAEEYTITVTNLQGQVVESMTGNNNKLFMLPMAKYPTGTYIVRLQQADKIWQQKVVKQ